MLRVLHFGALVFYQSYFTLAHIAMDMLHCILNLSISVGLCLQDGASPLYVASWEGHTDVVDILIKAGADIHQATKVCVILDIFSGE